MTRLTHHMMSFPCAVYHRARCNQIFTFSHICHTNRFAKPFPQTLAMRTLAEYVQRNVQQQCFRHTGMVLVTGDTARAVSVAQPLAQSIPFLFYKSEFARADHMCASKAYSELADEYVEWEFSSTCAHYDMMTGALQGVCEFPSCMIILPKKLRESEIPDFQHNMSMCIRKSMQHSLWVCGTALYYEWSLRMQRKRAYYTSSSSR